MARFTEKGFQSNTWLSIVSSDAANQDLGAEVARLFSSVQLPGMKRNVGKLDLVCPIQGPTAEIDVLTLYENLRSKAY